MGKGGRATGGSLPSRIAPRGCVEIAFSKNGATPVLDAAPLVRSVAATCSLVNRLYVLCLWPLLPLLDVEFHALSFF